MHFLSSYGIFFAKIITVVVMLLLLVGGIIALASKNKDKSKIKIKKLNDHYQEMQHEFMEALESKSEYKAWKKHHKETEEHAAKHRHKRIFVLEFEGDLRATAVEALREEITAILTVATNKDEVVLRLQSSGGLPHAYGLGAAQLERLKQRGIALTVAVDRVAASGGYLMSCVANRLLASPFAFIGSIGVVAQIPNFNRLLKRHDIEYEMVTAGEFKRTLSIFGENTSKGRKKLQEELDDLHKIFKQFVQHHRPRVDIDKVATGEVWIGTRAFELCLVDELITSDDYLLSQSNLANIYQVSQEKKKTLTERFCKMSESITARVIDKFWQQNSDPTYFL